MGFLDRLKQAGQLDLQHGWQNLTTATQLETIVAQSYDQPVVLFKHSISCGISAMIKNRLEADWDFSDTEVAFYYLDLINYRAISNQIANDFGVVHQSPQVIVLKDGKAIYNDSHHMVSVAGIRSALA